MVRQTKLKLIGLLTALLLTMTASGQVTTLVIELVNGQTASYTLAEKPVLTMQGTKLTIATSMVETSYERTSVARFYFSESATGIVNTEARQLTYTQTAADEFVVSDISAAEQVTVYDLSGKQYVSAVKWLCKIKCTI